MTDLTTPLAALTPVVTVGGKVGPIPDTTGADAMGLVTASPAAFSLLGRLKAIADAILGTLKVAAADGAALASEASLSALAAKLPASLGTKAASGSLSIVPATGADLATGTGVAAVVTALGTPLQAGGSVAVTVSALPTGAATQATLASILAKLITAPATEAKQDAALALHAKPGVGDLMAVPAGSTNGALVGTKPAAARAVRFLLPTGTSVTFTVAGAAPSSAPTTFTVSAADTGPNWDEPLADGVNVYVTAKTGSPLFRYL